MEVPCTTITAAIESGQSDEVNSMIDEIKALDTGDRIHVLHSCLDQLEALYREGNGYQRQSIVRIVNALAPATGLAAYEINEESRFADDLSRETFEDGVSRVTELYLEWLQDDDGRVRRAAVRGIKEVCSGYDMIGEQKPIRALIEEIDALPAPDDTSDRKHITEARDQAAFFLRSPADRLLTGLLETYYD